MKRITVLLCLIVCASSAFAGQPKEFPPVLPALPSVEAWRVQIENIQNGEIDLSLDKGKTWTLIGRVTAPATHHLMGYLAAGYAQLGTVAATSVHGIRIRVGNTDSAYPTLINIVPSQFANTPVLFGGHISGDSGIYTDIPAGDSLFREFAPLVGSVVLVKEVSSSDAVQPLPVDYSPAVGDVLTIVVRKPVNPLRELIFENKNRGDVTAVYGDGTRTIVTHVLKPVYGVGRFDGCSYTGVGAINTNHTCVITVSTAPVSTSSELEGTGVERRGGFQIVPEYHISQTEEADSPEAMIIGTLNSPRPELEGTPPIYYGTIGLGWSPDDPAHSWLCDVRTADKPDWQPMPTLVGLQPDIITKLHIVAFRIHHDADEDASWLTARALSAHKLYAELSMQMARLGKEKVSRGDELVRADVPSGQTGFVQFFVDGNLVSFSNNKPYELDWNTLQYPDGEHVVESRVLDDSGNVIKATKTIYYVDNSGSLAPDSPVHTSG